MLIFNFTLLWSILFFLAFGIITSSILDWKKPSNKTVNLTEFLRSCLIIQCFKNFSQNWWYNFGRDYDFLLFEIHL